MAESESYHFRVDGGQWVAVKDGTWDVDEDYLTLGNQDDVNCDRGKWHCHSIIQLHHHSVIGLYLWGRNEGEDAGGELYREERVKEISITSDGD